MLKKTLLLTALLLFTACQTRTESEGLFRAQAEDPFYPYAALVAWLLIGFVFCGVLRHGLDCWVTHQKQKYDFLAQSAKKAQDLMDGLKSMRGAP